MRFFLSVFLFFLFFLVYNFLLFRLGFWCHKNRLICCDGLIGSLMMFYSFSMLFKDNKFIISLIFFYIFETLLFSIAILNINILSGFYLLLQIYFNFFRLFVHLLCKILSTTDLIILNAFFQS